jgi:hypothetical protein
VDPGERMKFEPAMQAPQARGNDGIVALRSRRNKSVKGYTIKKNQNTKLCTEITTKMAVFQNTN